MSDKPFDPLAEVEVEPDVVPEGVAPEGEWRCPACGTDHADRDEDRVCDVCGYRRAETDE